MRSSEDDMAAYRATRRQRAAEREQAQDVQRRRLWRAARRVAALLRTEFGARRVALFGSVARGDRLGPRSDLDMAVWGVAADEYFRAVGEAQAAAAGPSVDLVRVEQCPSSLCATIQTDGVDL